MTKISVVGGGNAGVFTALYLAWYGRALNLEVELIYNPKIAAEPVGQATLLTPPRLLYETTGFNWYDNSIHATFKTGILYEGWGKINDKVFHPFPSNAMAMHYCPWEMQKHILNSGHFKVTERDVDPKDVDADYVFDCRGKPKDFSDYEELINPTNACILGKPNLDTSKQYWTRAVATPDGWTFVIPTALDSPSRSGGVGYCYNSNITSKEDAEKNMLEMFDVEITKHVSYNNYVAKNPVIDDRIILNGNRLFFIEPLESSATETYIEIPKYIMKYGDAGGLGNAIKEYIKYTQNFILWHYQFGSKYDTPFWNYASSLKFIDPKFDSIMRSCKNMTMLDVQFDERGGSDPCYGQWTKFAFKCWYDGMTKKEK